MEIYVPLSFVVQVTAESASEAYEKAVNHFILRRAMMLKRKLLIAEVNHPVRETDWSGAFSRSMKSKIVQVFHPGDERIISIYLTPRAAYIPELDELSVQRDAHRKGVDLPVGFYEQQDEDEEERED